MRYCVSCIMPETKPDLTFKVNGVCAACHAYETRREVDWPGRRLELEKIFAKHRSRDSRWDCVVPVSGGKDSTYQVIKVLEFGMTPLCVTSTTCDMSEIGRRNLDNIKKLGVDHM